MIAYETCIDGIWRGAASGKRFDTMDPFSGEMWASVPRCEAADVLEAVTAAQRAFSAGPWSRMSATERGQLLKRLGELVRREADQLARVEVKDNGKLIAEMRAQVRYSASWWEYYGGLADKLVGELLPLDKRDYIAWTRREPLGVIAAITPWNSPLMLATWKIAPALAAGNTVVWKPSEFTSVSALEFMRLVDEAGLPPGVINVVTGYGQEAGDPLVADPRVAKVAFTGGDETGRAVYMRAAAGLKPAILELGGKSANIVFADANLDEATKGAVAGIFAASGQTCIAGSRLLVERTIYDSFVERLVHFAGRARLGNPALEDTQVGPITTPQQHQKVLRYIDIGVSEGATVVLGGGPASVAGSQSGLFIQPTIFANASNHMRVAREEIFGPVLCVIPFNDEAEALAIANDSPYGLAAGVWTDDTKRAMRMAERLAVGTVWLNTYRAISFMAPFGGRGRSGFGRENGLHAIDEYLQSKSVWLFTGRETPDPFTLR